MNIEVREDTRIAAGQVRIDGREYRYVFFGIFRCGRVECELIVHSRGGTIVDSISRVFARDDVPHMLGAKRRMVEIVRGERED